MSRRRLALDGSAFGVLALVVLLLPLVASDFREFQLAYVGVYFIAALGLNILTGYAGQISLGHGGFMMIGAYVTAILSVKHGWNDLATIPVAGPGVIQRGDHGSPHTFRRRLG